MGKSIKKELLSAARLSQKRMRCGTQIAYTDQMQRLGEINIAPLGSVFIDIYGGVSTDLAAWHIYILAGMPVAKDNTAFQLGLSYQNISLRQSI